MGLDTAIERMRRGIRRHGVSGSIRHAVQRMGRRLYLNEAHHWYELELNPAASGRAMMPEGLRLVRASQEQLPLLERLPTVKLQEGERRLGEGAALWFVMEDDEPAFACWTFSGEMPAYAAPGGRMKLPEGAAGLEDSVTSPEYRGRGVAPAAWSAISQRLFADGYRTMVTKVEERNVPSRRAVEKAGFVDVGVMRLRKLARRRRVRLEGSSSEMAPYLSQFSVAWLAIAAQLI
jgi:RimJ/RimL family protein N-acetyltransferase